jgi:hypothetical protein
MHRRGGNERNEEPADRQRLSSCANFLKHSLVLRTGCAFSGQLDVEKVYVYLLPITPEWIAVLLGELYSNPK